MEYPWVCNGCGKQTMIDLLKLERRAVDKIVSVDGYVCGCGMWVGMFYSTIALREAFRKLEGLDVKRKDYKFHFGKVLRKAQGIRDMMV